MKTSLHLSVIVVVALAMTQGFICSADDQQKSNQPPIQWAKGPMTASLGDIAAIDIPKGYLFADGSGARKFLELTHNPSDGSELGIIVPQSNNETWFVLFEFDELGYVKDDEKASLDPAKILGNIQKNTEGANAERQKTRLEGLPYQQLVHSAIL